jgi:hypothetical protein
MEVRVFLGPKRSTSESVVISPISKFARPVGVGS